MSDVQSAVSAIQNLIDINPSAENPITAIKD